jgi:hypothetical protein
MLASLQFATECGSHDNSIAGNNCADLGGYLTCFAYALGCLLDSQSHHCPLIANDFRSSFDRDPWLAFRSSFYRFVSLK